MVFIQIHLLILILVDHVEDDGTEDLHNLARPDSFQVAAVKHQPQQLFDLRMLYVLEMALLREEWLPMGRLLDWK